jgi:hypothetical protein
MGEQRRRGGRGRSGKGGRIPPRRGEGAAGFAPGEAFTSFPEQVAPIRVAAAIDDAAVERTLVQTLERERRQLTALQAHTGDGADPALVELRAQVERHQGALEQLARTWARTSPARRPPTAKPAAPARTSSSASAWRASAGRPSNAPPTPRGTSASTAS